MDTFGIERMITNIPITCNTKDETPKTLLFTVNENVLCTIIERIFFKECILFVKRIP